MKEEKWLLRKASGSRAKLKWKGDYADDKVTGLNLTDELPVREGVKKAALTYLDSSLIERWLHNYVGQHFDYVYSEYLKRIQPKYRADYKNEIYQYLEPKETITFDEHGNVLGLRHGETVTLPYYNQRLFYIHPETHLLEKLTANRLH